MAQRILALELAGDRVQGALAERAWNSFHLLSVVEQERAADEADAVPALRRLIQQTGRPDVLITALPGELVTQRLLMLPFGDRRRLQQVVPFALEEHLPFSVDDAVVAFARVGREGANTLVIAAFSPKENLKRHLDLLARAGLDPKVVTLSALGLAGLFGRARNGRPGAAHLVLDIDRAGTSLVLLDPSGTPRALRTLAAALERRDGAPLSTPAANEIVTGVRQTLLAHAASFDQPDLILTGPAASAPRIRSQIAEALSINLRSAEEFDCAALLDGFRRDTVRNAACVSMLLGEAPARPLELLNFRQGEFSFHGRSRDLAPFYLPVALVAAVIVIAIVNLALGLSAGYSRLDRLDALVAAAAAPAIGPVPGAMARETLQDGIFKMEKRLKLLGGSLANNSPLDTLTAVSRALPPRMPAQMTDFVIDDSGLKLTGTADSFNTVDEVKRDLEQCGYFATVRIDHAKAANSGRVDFRISATFQALGAGVKADAR